MQAICKAVDQSVKQNILSKLRNWLNIWSLNTVNHNRSQSQNQQGNIKSLKFFWFGEHNWSRSHSWMHTADFIKNAFRGSQQLLLLGSCSTKCWLWKSKPLVSLELFLIQAHVFLWNCKFGQFNHDFSSNGLKLSWVWPHLFHSRREYANLTPPSFSSGSR